MSPPVCRRRETPVERKALAFGLLPGVKPASMKQEWNRGFGAFLRNPDFRRFSGTVYSLNTKKFYKTLADTTVIFHFVWIILLFTVPPLALIYPKIYFISLAITFSTGFGQLLCGGCPLVYLENLFRSKYDPNRCYKGSFVAYYLEKKFGIQLSPWFVFGKLIFIFVIVLTFTSLNYYQ